MSYASVHGVIALIADDWRAGTRGSPRIGKRRRGKRSEVYSLCNESITVA